MTKRVALFVLRAAGVAFFPVLGAVVIEAQKELNLWAAERLDRLYLRAQERWRR